MATVYLNTTIRLFLAADPSHRGDAIPVPGGHPLKAAFFYSNGGRHNDNGNPANVHLYGGGYCRLLRGMTMRVITQLETDIEEAQLLVEHYRMLEMLFANRVQRLRAMLYRELTNEAIDIIEAINDINDDFKADY